ncbi:hypothetical protein MNEG_8531 [Monoraphidium neglectum]|uniref:Uncharacterized protein n=1 Tax=Monoraphidium neglectum TaxID=145388 RepID=A0A0D2KVM5_9CHLO|nr:hypothetical protein MNEG_8531 [Monoraphidium neglectum]KIY99433.1 hypothetical protein MNEG_8531 [Monoraphidium neglectum]|eukprot:XP_013898453.1 hypothetical protein MNEG_8531 [Monoraphidium neglectum]
MLSGSLAVGSYGAALPGSFGGTGGALGGSVGASWVPSSDYSGRRDTLGVGSHFDLSSLGGSVHGGSAHGGSAHGGSTHGCAAAVILHGRSLGTFPSTVEALQASLDSSAGHHAASVEELLSFISAAAPGQPVTAVVAPSLQQLDSSALAALLKELGRQARS